MNTPLTSTEAILEDVDQRSVFGGSGSGVAINRHSVRYYTFQGQVFLLDKTLDGIPPFFSLYQFNSPRQALGKIIQVNGREYWDAKSWKQAETLAFQAIRQLEK